MIEKIIMTMKDRMILKKIACVIGKLSGYDILTYKLMHHVDLCIINGDVVLLWVLLSVFSKK